MRITILRLGHRYVRDKRITTHTALVARAFGADEILMDTKDSSVEESIKNVVNEWGGNFEIRFTPDWREYVKNFSGDRIHLTMYGINVNDAIGEIQKRRKDKLIIIGGKKVPSEIYSMVDYNVAIGNQPHSEVSALAVFLDRLFEGKELDRKFHGKKRIIPQEREKKVIETSI